MDIIPSTAPKSLTSDTTFSNYLLIVDAYYNIPKLYGMENITTEEVMDQLDMFQSRFGKIDQFGWWDLERISADAGMQFTIPAWASGFEQDTSVFSMFGVTGSRPQFRKPKKLSEGNITGVQTHTK